MTLRPRSHVLETQSRNRLERLFTDECWTVEHIRSDYGEDLLVRIFENDIASPYYFYVQVKATDKIERFRTASNALEVTVPVTQANTWLELAQPLFLMLWDASADVWHWCHVQTFLLSQDGRDRMSRGEASVRLPIANYLNATNLTVLTGIVREVTTWSTKAYQSLQVLKEQHDGAKLAIFGAASLTDASEQSDTPLVMIEEIEASLHPAAAHRMLDCLRDPKVQIGLRLKDLSGRLLCEWKQEKLRAAAQNEERHEGRAEEAARALLIALRVRGIAVPDVVRERILAVGDPEQLERWLENAIVATSLAEVLDEPS